MDIDRRTGAALARPSARPRLDSSAVPGARPVQAACAVMTRRLGPVYRLALRLWIATAPLGAALAAYGGSDPMRGGALAPWLASIPDAVPMGIPGFGAPDRGAAPVGPRHPVRRPFSPGHDPVRARRDADRQPIPIGSCCSGSSRPGDPARCPWTPSWSEPSERSAASC